MNFNFTANGDTKDEAARAVVDQLDAFTLANPLFDRHKAAALTVAEAAIHGANDPSSTESIFIAVEGRIESVGKGMTISTAAAADIRPRSAA